MSAEETIRGYLERYHELGQMANVSSGFVMDGSVTVCTLYPGERVFQYLRRSGFGSFDPKKKRSQDLRSPRTGNWFALKGASMDGLGIMSGGVGRQLVEFEVVRTVQGLEGTAAPLARDWGWDGGGSGGATQIFLASSERFGLRGLGTHLG